MGSEDLFRKRKAKKVEENARRNAKRAPYDRVLIICEGEKTEPYYFEEARVCLDLDSANIKIDGSCGSSPKSVVNYAFDEFRKEVAKGGHYDKVFCVFDRDSHESYDWAIHKVDEINHDLINSKYSDEFVFVAIRTNPAFEYWLLLHYTPSTKPYMVVGGKSVGEQVIDDLRLYIPEYKKTQLGIYKNSVEQGLLRGAIANSKRIFLDAEKSLNYNPSTNVYVLMEYLEKLKD